MPGDARPDAPLVVLLHGLEGSSASHYARALMVALMARGWRGVVPHFRGCSGEPNLMPRAYHSGDHAEARAMLDAIRARVPRRPSSTPSAFRSAAACCSIGWDAQGATRRAWSRAAAAVSTPLDLTAAGIAIGKGFNRIYTTIS